jgi:triacylglycerol lipase
MRPQIFVLVHGINDTSRKFKAMQCAFEDKGYRCIVPSLTPKNGSKGLEYLARQLKDFINTETDSTDAELSLVGFSMGALVSRYYLQELEGYRKVCQFFSISSPHHGSFWAYWGMNKGVQHMRPGSGFLHNLEQSAGCLPHIRCYSYWTPFDLMILPATSSLWNKAENIKINSLCYPLMVRNGQVIADILAKVEEN